MSGCILHLFILHSPVFLVNSCLDLFSAPCSRKDPFSRSYRVNLPSSLTMNLPSALVFSTQLRVSVCGTGICILKLSGFSRESDYPHFCAARRLCILSRSAQVVDLPATLNTYTLQRPFPSDRGGFTAPSPHRIYI